MEHIKSDVFTEIAHQCNYDAATIIKYIQENINPSYIGNVNTINNRISTLRIKGLLPLDSGNYVSLGEVLKGSSTLYGPDGAIKQQWIKTDVSKENALSAFKSAIESISNSATFSYTPTVLDSITSDDLMTIYPIGDPHIGMLAHAAETGADHDLAISEARFNAAISLAVEQAPTSTEAFIIDCGDWFHADDSNNKTPRGGNPLDVDGRYHKVIETGFRIATTMILSALTKHKTVHWRSAEGNHDQHAAIMLSYYLKAYFKDEPRVIIHCSPSMFFYHQFGKNLIGITHGHTAKFAALPGIMATDVPKAWGDTEFRYWYTGHIHHDTIKEMPGCKIETFRTLASKDAWHASMGYRSGQDIKTITLHKDYGEISRNTFNLTLIGK